MRGFRSFLFIGAAAGVTALLIGAVSRRQQRVASRKDPVLQWENEGGSVPEVVTRQQDIATGPEALAS